MSKKSKTPDLIRIGKAAVVVFVLCLITSCIEIINVNQPATVNVGEEFTITLDVEISDDAGSTLVFGFLAPRAWKAADNTTVSFTSSIGNSTMSPMSPDELDVENNLPWASQIKDKEGFGHNYGEVEWVVFKADNSFTPPASTSEDSPVTGKITVTTRAGSSNMIAGLGYFIGETDWGYIDDNSISFFPDECIEVTGGSGQAQNLCGEAPRKLVELETYTFNDLLTIVFDAQEDTTALIGANKVYFCSRAIHDAGTSEICEFSTKTEMARTGTDTWTLTLWPKSYYDIPDGSGISEILCNFQDESGNIIVRDNSGNDFQILEKCF